MEDMTSRWLSDTFKHRRREATHDVSFWDGNKASEEAGATSVSVSVTRGAYSSAMSFKLPEQKSMADALETMLGLAFEIGRDGAKREVRDVLGCT